MISPVPPAVYSKEKKVMHGKFPIPLHYSMLIQGSSTSGMFSWIDPYKYWNPYIISMTAQSKNNLYFTCPSIGNN